MPASDALLCWRRPRSVARAADLGGPRHGRRSFGSRLHADLGASVRDRPRRFLGRGRTPADPAALSSDAAPLGHGRAGARSDLQPAPSVSHAPGGSAVDRASRPAMADSREERLRWPTSITAPARSPGVRAGLGAQPGRARAPRLVSRGFSPLPAAGSPCPLCRTGPPRSTPRNWSRTNRLSQGSLATGCRSIGPSSWRGSQDSPSMPWLGSFSWLTNSSGRGAFKPISSSCSRKEPTSQTTWSMPPPDAGSRHGFERAHRSARRHLPLPQRATCQRRHPPHGDSGTSCDRRSRGPLSSQLDRIEWARSQPEPLMPSQPPGRYTDEPVGLPENLQYANGVGGFSPDGHAYCLLVSPEDRQLIQSNGQPASPECSPADPAAGSLDQRACQSLHGMPGFGERTGLHLGRQQPDQSTHRLEQRPGHRSAGRGALSA